MNERASHIEMNKTSVTSDLKYDMKYDSTGARLTVSTWPLN